MTLRAVAAFSVLLGVGILLFFLQLVGKAPWSPPEMRHLRAMKDRTAVPVTYAPYTFRDFLALPHHPPLARTAEIENRGVSFVGYVQYMLPSTDGDYHLELAPTPRRGAPDTTYQTAEITPAFRRPSRTWDYEALIARLHPNHGGVTPWPEGPRRTRISGWLCYDFQYDVDRLRPEKRAVRLTGWEIHPVTRIEVWDERRGGYAEVGS